MTSQPDPIRRHLAFLRAVNVGGHTVKMDRLRALFEEMGMREVSTYIASGNVVFGAAGEAGALERRIEEHLERSLGYPVATFLRSPEEVRAAAELRPFPAAEAPHALYVAFLKAPPEPAVRERILAMRTEVDDFHVRGREVYWSCRVPSMESAFSGAVLERTLGAPATMRNVNTVRKLAAKYAVTP